MIKIVSVIFAGLLALLCTSCTNHDKSPETNLAKATFVISQNVPSPVRESLMRILREEISERTGVRNHHCRCRTGKQPGCLPCTE